MQGDLRHRSLGKPGTYGDHINSDLLLRTCTSWAMWCSTTFTVWYRLKSQKSVYHVGAHSMYWEYRSFCSHLWVFLSVLIKYTWLCGTVERKTSSLSPWRLTMLWKKCWRTQSPQCTCVDGSGNQQLLVPPVFPLVVDKGLVREGALTNYSQRAGRLSAEPGAQAKQDLSGMNTLCCSTTPNHLWLDWEANKDPNNNNLCRWQMRWTIKGENHLRVVIDSSALHLPLPSPSFLHSSPPLTD